MPIGNYTTSLSEHLPAKDLRHVTSFWKFFMKRNLDLSLKISCGKEHDRHKKLLIHY